MVTRAPHGLTAHLPVGEGAPGPGEKGTLRGAPRGEGRCADSGVHGLRPSRLASGSDVRFPFPFFFPPPSFTLLSRLSRDFSLAVAVVRRIV